MPLKVIDVAGGTGDISFRILNKAKADSPHSKFLKQTNYNDRVIGGHYSFRYQSEHA